MKRKDCESIRPTPRRIARAARAGHVFTGAQVLAILFALGNGVDVHAGAVRMWPTAVVVSDTIRLDEVCALRGFDRDTEALLASTIITDSPTSGGSRVVHLEMIRSAVAAQGVSMAEVTFGGALRCAVTRPTIIEADREQTATSQRRDTMPGRGTGSMSSGAGGSVPSHDVRSSRDALGGNSSGRSTLRQAVIDHFGAESARYHGKAEVVFDRTDEQVLNLSGPDYSFRVRTRGDVRFGLVPVEVDVVSRDRIDQTIPLVVQVSMLRPTVVARRAINQGASIRSADVDVISLRYTALTRLGIGDAQRVVGQRAKRLIRAGTAIDSDMLERVPLVVRGQLVSVASVVGGVRVVTSGKAAGDGHLGEVITVRHTDGRRVEVDATVVGPGRVQIGGHLPTSAHIIADGGSGS